MSETTCRPTLLRLLALACALSGTSLACKPAAPPASAAADAKRGPLPERTVAIRADQEGFTPSRIEAQAGEPLLLRFTRTAEVTCADQIVLGTDPKKIPLPLRQPVDLHVVAPESGALAFACGMHMYKGSVVVK
jgi:plastocyanin domain-containing protein